MEWETVIGLEIHVQLKTKSKIFSGSATAYGAEPNTQASAIDLGFPGVLPVLNKEAVELAVRFGTSIGAEITPTSIFARKNYFYPDLPKGYQISQYELPIVGKGQIDIDLGDGKQKCIGITRAHLEEDAGKSVHENMHGFSGIDLNRAGTPLLEIVSEPDMRDAKEAVAYVKTLHNLVRYLGISDGNMQEGSFRCDVNVSIRPKGQKEFGTRTEIKNLNSFRFIEKAILHEAERQQELIESGGKVVQATCLYDPDLNETRLMRTKEEAHDYRYFPDPDLLPIKITSEFINSVKQALPELPWEKSTRFQEEHKLNQHDANFLANDLSTATYFEATLKANQEVPAKMVATWIIGDISARLNKEGISFSQIPVTAEALSQLLTRVADQTISRDIAKKVFEAMWNNEGSADEIIEKQGLKQISDTGELEGIIDEIIQNNPQQVEQFRQGKEKLIAFFVGQVMKATKGKANPGQVNQLLKAKLKS